MKLHSEPPPSAEPLNYTRLRTWFLGIVAFAVVLTILVEARFILVSLVFALLIFSLTSQVINAVSRLRLGRWTITSWLASIVSFAIIAIGLLGISALFVSQANTVVLQAVTLSNQGVRKITELAGTYSPEAAATVEAAIRSFDINSYLRAAAGQASNALSASLFIILFVGFLYAERMFFANKLLNMVGSEKTAAKVATIANTIVGKINRYLLVKATISFLSSMAIFIIATLFGLELALPIAVMAFILNFIPSIGSVITVIMLGTVALIQFDPITAGIIVALAVVSDFCLGSVLDPTLMGQTLRISPFGIIISLAFWSAVWGIPGAFLAVPIMVAIKVTCTHIPSARPMAVLLSRDGVLED